ncbi:MAG TPA: hypothetical protein VIQ28_07805, partial [Burkholderiales bacterium]
MSNERPHELFGNLAPLIAIALLATGVFVFNAALKSSRPGDTDRVSSTISELQDVPARLWQDPFAAVADAIKEGGDLRPVHRPAALWNTLCGFHERTGQQVQLLAVTLPTSSYAEDAEMRRRVRYAVVAGLTAMAYAPLDPDGIGYVLLPRGGSGASNGESEWLAPQDCTTIQHTDASQPPTPNVGEPNGSAGDALLPGTLPARVPYEIYRPQHWNPAQSLLLVLWLEDPGWAGGRYIERMEETVRRVCGTQRDELCNAPVVPEVNVIGPGSSAGLHSLVLSLAEVPDLGEGNINFYSPFATAPRDALDRSVARAMEMRRKRSANRADKIAAAPISKCVLPNAIGVEAQHEGRCVVRVIRTIGGDDELAAMMTAELGLRGVNGRRWSCNDPVVFISERDTTYGQELAEQFSKQLAQAPACVRAREEWPGFDPTKALVWEVGYFRGLDGLGPGDTPQQTDADTGPQGRRPSGIDQLQLGAATQERAEGRSQFDYVQRLADAIRTRESNMHIPPTLRDLYHFEGRPKIKAVGVLGNDVYDKLLMLQAMHGSYSYAMFFTTDLDARLLQKEQNDWARNLIVASHYGLSLRRELQGATPPFRSGYQTSAYLATLMAMQPADKPIDSARLIAWNQPRTYELGRTQAIALTPTDGRADDTIADDCTVKNLSACATVHPAIQAGEQPQFVAVLAVLSVGGLLLLSSVSLRGYLYRRPWITLGSLALLGVLCATVLSRAVRILFAEASEPFTWVEGVSLWPSVFLLSAALLVALLSRLWIGRTYRAALKDIGAEFFNDARAERYRRRFGRQVEKQRRNRWPGNVRERLRAGVRNFRRRLADYHHWDLLSGGPRRMPGSVAWEGYYHRSHPVPSRARIWPLAIVCFLLGYFLFLLGPQILPFRGEWAWAVCAFMYVVSGLALLALIFYVVDVIRLSNRFICWIACSPTRYPEQTLVRHAAGLGLSEPCIENAIRKPHSAHALDCWVDFQFVVRLTSEVERYLYFPFIVLALFILAQTRLFDDWQPSPAVVAAILIALGYAIYCVRSLRKAAEDAREYVLREYRALLVRSMTDADAAREIPPDFLNLLLARISESQ